MLNNPTPKDIELLFSAPMASLRHGVPGGFALPIGWIVMLMSSIEANIDNMIQGLRGLSLEEMASRESQPNGPFGRKRKDLQKLARDAMPQKIFAPLPEILKRAEELQTHRNDLVHGAWYYQNPNRGNAGKMRPGPGDGSFRPAEFTVDQLWLLVWKANQIEAELSTVRQHYNSYLFYRHPEHAHFEVPDEERALWD